MPSLPRSPCSRRCTDGTAGDVGRQAIRVGLSAGDVTWDDGDCFGTPVIEAARLCAVADGGQILAADVVRVLGSRPATDTR